MSTYPRTKNHGGTAIVEEMLIVPEERFIATIPLNKVIDEPTRCNNDLLIYKISSTCFGQSFAHHQERETEIFTAYGILLLWWAGRR